MRLARVERFMRRTCSRERLIMLFINWLHMTDEGFDFALDALIRNGVVIQIPDSEERLAYYVNPRFNSFKVCNN